MSRARGFLIAIAIVAGAVLLAMFLVSMAPEAERRELPSQVPFVETAPVVAGSGAIPVYAAGTVRPAAEVHVAPEVGGKVVWVSPSFQSGRRVEAGQTLFRIEEADYVSRLREAEAGLAAREAAYLQAQEEADAARAEYARYAGREPDAGTVEEASPLARREPQLNAARAALERDRARVAEGSLAVARTRITAPFDGFVREESVDLGQFVTAGRTVARLFAADAVEVVAPLSDDDAALIPRLWASADSAEGARVAARVLAEFGEATYAWRGHVDRAEAALDAQTRTIDVIVRVPDPFEAGTPEASTRGANGGPPLLVGKFVEVEIEGLTPQSYYRVRRAALRTGNVVWAVRDDGTVGIVPVRVLQRGDDEVFVTGDLEPGQQVIVRGVQFATDGMAVRSMTSPQS